MSVSRPDPRELKLPLRDLVRGLRQKTSLPRAMLAPALVLLPEPLRNALKDIGRINRSMEPGSRSNGQPDMAVITRSAAAMHGADASALDIAAAASFSIRVLLDAANERDLLISETLLAICWHDAEARPIRAASFLRALFEREPFGVAPGLLHTGADLLDEERLRICIAVVLWLLSDHNDEGISEVELINIAGWLALDCREASRAQWNDPEKLESVLIETAGRI